MTRRNAPTGPGLDGVERIGEYPVLRLIGEGASGRVYACRDPSLGRVVAIKVLHARVARDPVWLERFRREARALARISSLYVAALHQVGAHAGSPYLVLEHLEGEDLETRLAARGPLPPGEALGYARDAAHALQAANAVGVLHRDVKPGNLIVANKRARLTDFGLARLLGEEGDQTRDGVVAGAVDYVAPERLRGEPGDLRSDIYALGATLYALLAGRAPFVRATPAEVVTAHLEEAPAPLSVLRGDVPPDVEALVSRMMAKRPSDRFQSYHELLPALELLLASPAAQLRVGEAEAFADEPTEAYDAPPFVTMPLEAPLDLATLPSVPPPNMLPPATDAADDDALMPQPTGVLGNLKQMSLAEIAQMLELGQKSAQVELIPTGAVPGEVAFDRGRLVYARTGDVVGAEAFYALAARREGFFRIHYDRTPTEINVDAPLGFLMLEAMRRIDEARADGGAPAAPSSPEGGFVDEGRTHEVDALRTASQDPVDTMPEGLVASASEDRHPAPDVDRSRERLLDPTLLGPPPALDDDSDLSSEEDRDLESGEEDERYAERGEGARARPAERSPFDGALPVAKTVLMSMTTTLLRPLASRKARGGNWRRPALLAASVAVLVVTAVVLALVVRAPGRAEGALLARIDGGEATQVLLELSRVPAHERVPRDELLRGHALARLDRPDEAVAAYRTAARAGVVDDRALELLLSRLDREEPSAELDALIDWPDPEVTERLWTLVKDPRWAVRQNAVVVLEGRGESEGIDREALAIQDLLTGPDCLARRKGLLVLKAIGKSERAREALKEAARRGGENLCMERELREMMPQVMLR